MSLVGFRRQFKHAAGLDFWRVGQRAVTGSHFDACGDAEDASPKNSRFPAISGR